MNRSAKILLCCALVASAPAAFAWVTGVDPSAASFPLVGRDLDIGYTGDFSWSETIMTVPGRNGLDVGLVLTYSSDIGIDQEASWVGLGFGLNVGHITRAVVNMPDELEKDPQDPDVRGVFAYGTEVHQWWDPVSDEVKGDDFIRPQDRFYLVLPGGGGEIIASNYDVKSLGGDPNNVNNIRFNCTRWRPWKIVPHFSNLPGGGQRYIDSFTVTTEDGTVYKFGTPCWSQLTVGRTHRDGPILKEVYDQYYNAPRAWPFLDGSHDYPKAPYIWYLEEILSPDYVDSDGTPGPSDGDEGNWAKLTYYYFTVNQGSTPYDIEHSRKYWTRMEMYFRLLGGGEDIGYFHQNKTRLHMACLQRFETPTHVAEFHTSNRSGGDAVDWDGLHPRKLDEIILKSKYQASKPRIARVAFSYDTSLAYDRVPVTLNPEGLDGGRLTLLQVQRFGLTDGDKVPPYSFEYDPPIVDNHDYEWHYCIDHQFREKWGKSCEWAVSAVNVPTGGRMEINYEKDSYCWDQTQYIPGGAIGGGLRTRRIKYKTGFQNETQEDETPMEVRAITYQHGDGVALFHPGLSKKTYRYKTSAVLHKDNYVAYDFVEIHEPEGFNDETMASYVGRYANEWGQPDGYRDRIVNYISAHPDNPYARDELYLVGPDQGYIVVRSREWMRGVPETIFMDCGNGPSFIRYWYGAGGTMHQFKGKFGEGQDYFIESYWDALWEEEVTQGSVELYEDDGVRYKIEYVYQNPPPLPDHEDAKKVNGLPKKKRVYRSIPELGGFDFGEERGSTRKALADFAAAAGRSAAGGLVGIVKGETSADDAATAIGDMCSGVGSKLLTDFVDTLQGWERVRTTLYTYAYERDDLGLPYTKMDYDDKHMMSQIHRVETKDHDLGRMTMSETHYKDFDTSDELKIYPEYSWVFLDKDGEVGTISENEKIKTYYLDYDDWGNLTHTQDHYFRDSYTYYSFKHALPFKFVNHLGHEKIIGYDDVTGLIKSVRDPNDLITDYEYDGLGQLTKVWFPNRPKSQYYSSPSILYSYNWACTWPPDYKIDVTKPHKGINWKRTGKLTENPEYRWTTSYYNGLGECFRTIKHYNTPQTDGNGDPMPGYFEGMYYDEHNNKLGLLSRKFLPYYAENSGTNWNDALRIPFLRNDRFTEGEVYVPFTEYIYKCNELYGPDLWETYGPIRRFEIVNGEHGVRPVHRFKYFAEENNDPYYPDDVEFNVVESYDEEGRAIKKYYDCLGRHVKTEEGAKYDVLYAWYYSQNGPEDWGPQEYPYQTCTRYFYDDVDRLIVHRPPNAEPPYPSPLETTYTYDTLSRNTSIEDPDRDLITYAYDDVGNLASFQDPELRAQGKFVMYSYDDLYRLKSEFIYQQGVPPGGDAGDGGLTFSFGLDLYGRQVKLYDSLSRRLGEKRGPGKGILDSVPVKKVMGLFDDLDADVKITYHYDSYPTGGSEDGDLDEYPTDYPIGKLTWTEDLIGKKFFYYDNMGRTVATVSDRCYFDNDVSAHEYYYNVGGDLRYEMYPSGTKVYYEYDKVGRLINIPGVYGDWAGPPPDEDVGSLNRPDSPGLGSPGRGVTSRILPSLKARRRAVERNPQNLTYYAMGGVNPLLDEDVTHGFEYDARGRIHYIRPKNGCTTTINYDNNYESQVVKSISFYMIANPPDITYQYDYDASRNVTEIRDNLAGMENDRLRAFQYDTLNRLIDYDVGWDTGDTGFGGRTMARAFPEISGGLGSGMDEEEPELPPYQFYHQGMVHYHYDVVGNREYEERDQNIYYYSYHANTNRLAGDPWGNAYTYNENGALASKVTTDATVYNYTYDYAGRLIKIEKAGGDAGGAAEAADPAAPADGTGGPPTVARGFGPARPGTAATGVRAGNAAPPTAAGPAPAAAAGEKADSSLDYLSSSEGPFVSAEEEWEFTYDGAGVKIYKENDHSASKYVHDASGRVVMELSNDVRKSSASVVKNPSFEIYSSSPWSPDEGGDEREGGAVEAAVGEAVATAGRAADAAKGTAGYDAATVGDFGYWEEDVGEATVGEIVRDGDDPLEGRFAAKMARAAPGSYDFRLKQRIPVKNDPPRVYEVRFFAKTSQDFSGSAYAYITTRASGQEPADAVDVLSEGLDTAEQDLWSDPIAGDEWREYRIVFASEKTSVSLQLVMNKEATGAVYFDRVSVAEYQNDLENASFEDQGELVGDTFDNWVEEHSGGVVEVGDGILTEDSAKITRTDPGAAPTEIWQTQGVLAGKTYELTALMKGENLVGARTFIMVEMAGYPPYYIEGPEAGDSGWGLYRGHYAAPAQDDLKVHLGIDGGTGVVYFEDVGMKEVPDVCENNDFEENYVEPEDTIGFVGWTYELNGGAVELEPLPHMNHAAAQLLRASDGGVRSILGGVKNLLGGGFDDDPIGNTILKQRINCLPRTEYEVTVFAKHNITAKNDYHGAFAVVGNITGSMQIDAITVYTGDYVEVFNLEVGSSDWTAYTARFTSSEDWFEITLGVGATAVGSASFDAVLIRDLTTRRYEYIYGLGRKLATLEYEGNVPEGQLCYDHYDLIGSPVMRTDFDSAVVWKGDYAPFGETLEEQPVTWGSQYRFLGNEDDGGLMDFGARFYDPRVGRFISPDPIQDVSSSQCVNPYVYCANNPLRYTDKFGLSHERPESNVGADDGARRGDPTFHLVWDPFTGYLNFVPMADYGNIIVFRHCSFEVEGAVLDQAGFIKACEAGYNRLLADHNFAMVLQAEKAKQDAEERRWRAALFGDVSDVYGLILYEYDVPGSPLDKVNGEVESERIIREGAEQGNKIMALGFYSEFAEVMVVTYRDALAAGGASFKKGAIIAHTRGLTFDGTLTGEIVPYSQKFASLDTRFWQNVMIKVSNPAGADWNVVGCYLNFILTEVLSVYTHINIIEAGSGVPGGCRVSPQSGWRQIRNNFLGY